MKVNEGYCRRLPAREGRTEVLEGDEIKPIIKIFEGRFIFNFPFLNSRLLVEDALMTMVKFCDRSLRESEEGNAK